MKENTYPVIGHIETEAYGPVPILNIRMMSDEREKELGAMVANKWKEAGAS